MAYTKRHALLTIGGVIGGLPERWQIGLRWRTDAGDTPIPTQAQVDACVTPIRTWFNAALSQFPTVSTVDMIKLAPIGTDGRYPVGTDAVEAVITPAITGGSAGASAAPQLSWSMGLTTAYSRGKGHIGRVYPAPLINAAGPNGQITTAQATQYMGTLRTMLNSLNTALSGLGSLAIMTQEGVTGPATEFPVLGLRMGVTADTQRRRRRNLPETYQTLAL